MRTEVFTQANILWEYLKLGLGQEGSLDTELHRKSIRGSQVSKFFQGILVFGCHDLRVAVEGARINCEKLAPGIIVTGGYGRITRSLWNLPEAEKFAEVMMAEGVPEKCIVIEPKASNTGENIQLARQIVEEQWYLEDSKQHMAGTDKSVISKRMDRWIAVTVPYRERRTLAALEKQWPECRFFMTSPRYGFQDYWDRYARGEEAISLDEWVSLLAGEVQRLIIYGGDVAGSACMEENTSVYQTFQAVPADVLGACKQLVDMGYKRHLI